MPTAPGTPKHSQAEPFVVRDARGDEREAALEVTLAAYGEYRGTIPDFAWEEYLADIRGTLLGNEAAIRIVAERAGRIVGSVLILPPPMTGMTEAGEATQAEWPEVRLLGVLPEERGRGIGRALMEECARRARAMGHARLGLHTADLMAIAKAMYERMGYTREPQLDFNPVPGVVITAYSLDLT